MKFLDLDREYACIDWVEAIKPVFDAKQFINGPQVKEFEHKIAEFIGVENAIGVSSGTSALEVALLALDVKDKVVLTTPYTFIATVEMPIRLGAKVIFCDIDDSFNMDMKKAKEIIATKDVDVLLLVHLFGLASFDLEEDIRDLCKKRGVKIVEDCAQALGTAITLPSQPHSSKPEWRHVGTECDISCFSFFPAKNLGCAGDGGLVATNDDALAQKCRAIRNHGSFIKYHNEMHGGNFRLDSVQAALMSAKLPHVTRFIASRRASATFFNNELHDLPLKCPVAPQHFFHSYCQYVIQVEPEDRDLLKNFLNDKEVPTAIYYPSCLSEQPCYEGIDFECECTNSKAMCKKNLALPIAFLTEDERHQVIRSIREYYEQ